MLRPRGSVPPARRATVTSRSTWSGAMIATVFLISASYSHIIELFPSGGGGYLVATKLLGHGAGDRVGDARSWWTTCSPSPSRSALGVRRDLLVPATGVSHGLKLARGVRDRGRRSPAQHARRQGIGAGADADLRRASCVSHVALIAVRDLHARRGARSHPRRHRRRTRARRSASSAWLGVVGGRSCARSRWAAARITGIEAVSNSVDILREPRVETGKRTMLYMAISLAFTAGGILLCYLLNGVQHAARQDAQRVALGAARAAAGRGRLEHRHRDRGVHADLARARCCSWPRRPGSSPGRARSPPWPWISGCPSASPTSPSGW